MELRAGDRIRWTRNDTGLGLVNSDTAEVAVVRGDRVAFRLGDGRTLELGKNDPQRRHLDHAWASTVHAFQGHTVDNVIAVMEAKHPKLSTQKSFYVEISRARHNAELVTDDAKTLRETLEAATGERVSALEGIGAADRALAEEKARGGGKDRGRGLEAMLERPAGTRDEAPESGREPERQKSARARTHRGAGQVPGIARHRDGDVVRSRPQDQAVPAGRLRSMTKISIDERRASGNRSISIRSSSPGVLGRGRPSGCLGRFMSGTSPNHSTI